MILGPRCGGSEVGNDITKTSSTMFGIIRARDEWGVCPPSAPRQSQGARRHGEEQNKSKKESNPFPNGP